VNRPLTKEQAADFTNYSYSQFSELVACGKFRVIKPFDNSHPRFLPSQLIEDMQNWENEKKLRRS
jgi:hypothetical protein